MPLTENQAKPTDKDVSILKAFRTCLKLDRIKEFSSDTFRLYQFNKLINSGYWFTKMKLHDIIREVGRTRSQYKDNHHREIRVWMWTGKKLPKE